jgi:hypothetical protein
MIVTVQWIVITGHSEYEVVINMRIIIIVLMPIIIGAIVRANCIIYPCNVNSMKYL